MTQVFLTQAQILAGLNRDGYRLNAGQFTFSIPVAGSLWPGYAPGEEPSTGYQLVTPAQAAMFRQALNSWDELILPRFVEVADTATARGELRVAFTSYGMDDGTAAYAYFGLTQTSGGPIGDIWINVDLADESFGPDTFFFEVLVHEIGHTLGLSHSFAENDGDTPIPAPYENTRFVVMSYTEETAGTIVTFRPAGGSIRANFTDAPTVTPMVIDIAAVQAIYGADPTTRSGDTVYKFNQDNATLQTIYDAGGNDTIDLSNFTRPNTIDLNAGAYSSVGEFSREAQIDYWVAQYPAFASFIRSALNISDLFTHADNVGIAFSTTIENATGGSASDRITGNAVANVLMGMGGGDTLIGGDGDDRLDGGAGNDTLTGGTGRDVFIFRESANDSDKITDFSMTEDQFDLAGRQFTRVTEASGGTTLSYGEGEILLAGVTGLTLAAANARVVGAVPVTPTPTPTPMPTPTPTPTPTPMPTPTTSQFSMILGTGVQATVTGTGSVTGAAGVQDVTVRDAPGTITFGPTFNTGGDRIHLAGSASGWTVARSGTTAVLSDGDSVVQVAAGPAGIDLIFADGVRTLRIDEAAGAIKLGTQALSTIAQAVTSAAGPATATDATDSSLPGQMLLTGPGPVTAIGNLQLSGSTATAETVVVAPGGRIAFGPTFNAGGDTIQLPGSAEAYTAVRSGSTVVLTSATERVSLPASVVGVTLSFSGGGNRLLFIDETVGVVKIGTQAVGTTAAVLVFNSAAVDSGLMAAFGADRDDALTALSAPDGPIVTATDHHGPAI